MIKFISFSIGLFTLLITQGAQATISNGISRSQQITKRHYAQWRWGTPIPTTRPEVVDAINRDNARRQQEAEAWARSPHNPENQDPEIRGLNNSARHKFYGERGLMKLEQGDYARAISYFNKAVAINRFSSGVYHNRGLAKRKLNDLSGALADYNLAISLKESAESYAQRGFVKDSLNDLQGALEDYNKAISMELDPVTYFNRAYTKRRVNDRAGAIQDFREAARLFKQQGKTEDYQDTLNQLQKMNATL
jgi:tetratricopeptide (TPR) repeat protein